MKAATWILLFSLLVIMNQSYAQKRLTLKGLKKRTENLRALPYSIEQLWLFEQAGGWGLFSESIEQITVPPYYDLALPSQEKGLYYIMKDQYVGVYSSISTAELIEPNQFSNLELFRDVQDQIHIRYIKKIVNKGSSFTTYSSEQTTYVLEQSTDSVWEARKINKSSVIVRNQHVHQDKMDLFNKTNWIHLHSHLDTKLEVGENGRKSYVLMDVLEQSGVISSLDKEYQIPAIYTTVNVKDTYLEVSKAIDLNSEVAYQFYLSEDGMYTLDFDLMFAPIDGGEVGTIIGGGFYSYADSQLEIFDSSGQRLTTIHDFQESLDEIVQINEMYYLACDTYDGEELEMRVFDQFIYSKDGQLLNQSKFGFEGIYDDIDKAIISAIDPDGDFDMLFGLLDLASGEVLLQPENDNVTIWYYIETLTACQSNNCEYYIEVLSGEVSKFFDEEMNPLSTANKARVYGSGYTINPEVNTTSSNEDLTLPFIPSHFVDMDYDDGWGMEYTGARVADEYKGLKIFETYQDLSEETKYGLAFDETQSFLLAPAFDGMSFDKEANILLLTYEKKSYSFPMSRYEK